MSSRLLAGLMTLGVFSIIGAIAVWGFGSMMVASSPSHVDAASPPARDITLYSADHVRLAGTYWPGRSARSPAILILHGLNASRQSALENAAWLNSLGYAVLTIDLRGHGQSQSAEHSFGLFESRDAAAAFSWLKRGQYNAPVAIIGISLGGAASLLGDDGPLNAQAMVLQAVFPTIRDATRNRIRAFVPDIAANMLEPLLSYQSKPRLGIWPDRLSPLHAIRKYRGPLLIIGGGGDQFTPPSEVQSMYDAAPGRKSLWIVDGASHRDVSILDTDEYRSRVQEFLMRAIGNPR